MKVSRLFVFVVPAGLLLYPAIAVPPVTDIVTSGSPTIRSISVDGTNLVFTTVIPSGFDSVTLEMRPSLNVAWAKVGQVDIESGEASFTIPKPSYSQGFFRLNATSPAGVGSQSLSPELQYVTTRSLASNLDGGDAVLHFKGMIDGSDRILLTRDGAMWTHVNWDWPGVPVTVNGNEWVPSQRNYLTTPGSKEFLPMPFSLDAISFRMIRGRDIVALERTENGLLVYLDDTPGGADEYEFEIRFHPYIRSTKRIETPGALLRIAARIDGSDRVRITRKQATWEHLTYGLPENVSVNGISWDVGQTNVLENGGATAFLPADVDFSDARIVTRKGRDVATMWADNDSLLVTFADNPNGADDYELDISFGQ